MLNLNKKEIKENQELISDELKRIREEKGISLVQASKDLQISKKYLVLLETGNKDALPEGVYGKNFLKRYSTYLGLEPEKIADEYFEKKQSVKNEHKKLFIRKTPHAFYFMAIPRLAKNIAIFCLGLILFTYLGFAAYNIISPPEMKIISPENDFQTKERRITIKGLTEPETNILINNESILVQDNGNFEKAVNLQTGINTITISAQKKYSRTKTVIRKILVES